MLSTLFIGQTGEERKHGFCSPKSSIAIYTHWNLSEKN